MGKRSKSQHSTTLASFFKLMKILGVVLVFEGLLWLLLQAVGPVTGFGRVVRLVMHIVGVATTLLVLSPIIGQLITASISEIFRALMSVRTLVSTLRSFLLLHILLLLASPWYLYWASAEMGRSKLTIAYSYAALVGAILGGIVLLSGYLPKLKR